MAKLPQRLQPVMRAILAGREPWQPVGSFDAGELAELYDLGWVECWELTTGMVVTLSEWAAERLGYRVDPAPDAPRSWVRVTSVKTVPAPEAAEATPDPVVYAMRGPFPTLLLGSSMTWRTAATPTPCDACGGAVRDRDHYCLRCDRWGRDGAKPPVRTQANVDRAAAAAAKREAVPPMAKFKARSKAGS